MKRLVLLLFVVPFFASAQNIFSKSPDHPIFWEDSLLVSNEQQVAFLRDKLARTKIDEEWRIYWDARLDYLLAQPEKALVRLKAYDPAVLATLDADLQAKVKLLQLQIRIKQSNYNGAFEELERLRAHFLKEGQRSDFLRTHKALVDLNFLIGDYEEVIIRSLSNPIKLKEEERNHFRAEQLRVLARAYMELELYPEAQSTLAELRMYVQPEDSYLNSYVDLQFAKVFQAQTKTDSARYYFQLVNDNCEEQDHHDLRAESLRQLALLDRDQSSDQEIVIGTFHQALDLSKKENLGQLTCDLYLDLAHTSYLYNKLGAANGYLDSCVHLAEAAGGFEILIAGLDLRHKILDDQGEVESSMVALGQINNYKDSLSQRENRNLKLRSDLKRKTVENQLLDTQVRLQNSRSENQSIVIFVLLFGLIFLSIIFGILRKRNAAIQKLNAQLHRRNAQIEKISTELRDLNLDLEGRIEKRTEALKKQNEHLLRYSYLNAHEVRGPLASIMGATEMLAFPNLSDEEKTYIIDGIKEQSGKLDTVLHRINDELQTARDINQNSIMLPRENRAS